MCSVLLGFPCNSCDGVYNSLACHNRFFVWQTEAKGKHPSQRPVNKNVTNEARELPIREGTMRKLSLSSLTLFLTAPPLPALRPVPCARPSATGIDFLCSAAVLALLCSALWSALLSGLVLPGLRSPPLVSRLCSGMFSALPPPALLCCWYVLLSFFRPFSVFCSAIIFLVLCSSLLCPSLPLWRVRALCAFLRRRGDASITNEPF